MPTQYPPLATWTEDDHSGPIIIVTTLCLFYWLIPGILQQAVSLSRDLRLTLTGVSFTLSMVLGIVQSSLILVACHYGLGKSANLLEPREMELAKRFYYISNLLFILVLGLVKCSVALLITNLTVNQLGSLKMASRNHKMSLAGVLVLTIIWTSASVVVLALPCGSQATCVGIIGRWRAIFAGDAVTDIAIALFAANIIWRTHAAFRVRLMWYFPFCLRLCSPICAGLRLITISRHTLTQNPTLAPWLFVVLGQTQLLISLVGYTSPALKKTMLDLATNYGTVGDSQAGSRGQKGGSYALKDIRYRKDGAGASWQGSKVGKRSTPFASGGSKAVAEGGDGDSDGDSQKGIIRCDEVEITFTHATPEGRANKQWM